MTRRLYALIVISVLFLPAGPALSQQDDYVRYDNWKILQVDARDTQQLEQLGDLGARLLGDYARLGLVEFYAPPEIIPGLEELGVEYKVLNDNLQKTIDAERARLAKRGPVDPRGRDWFDDYKDMDAIYAKLQDDGGRPSGDLHAGEHR